MVNVSQFVSGKYKGEQIRFELQVKHLKLVSATVLLAWSERSKVERIRQIDGR
jgi:hypothetical protein